jgi:protocatechuate 3,4-dioxygenase, alpha subunit
VPGERIRIVGRVLDGAGKAVGDAMIEIWQADSQGRYAHPADGRASNATFRGFGRFGTGTDPESRFAFHTIKPGSVDGAQAPHVNVIVFMRGMLSHAYTRIYFSDDPEANARDPVLTSVPEERRRTLVAEREESAAGTVYHFDIVMQGDDETVFFDV